MHADILRATVEIVRKRVAEGDCPTIPALPTGTAEDCIIALADQIAGLTTELVRTRAELDTITAQLLSGG